MWSLEIRTIDFRNGYRKKVFVILEEKGQSHKVNVRKKFLLSFQNVFRFKK